ncbi:10473_t:CDS:2, partial [Racocetra persica]
LDDKTISEQLEQFIVEVRKSNGQEYKASSLYTGFCAIARGISEAFENIRAINLFDKHKFKILHRTLDGRKGSHDTMMHSMCKDAKLDFKGHTITNHSMCSTGIHSLVESGVTLDEQMIFSRHKTIAGVSAYQHQSLKRKLDNVSYLIPIEEAEPPAMKDSTSIHNNQIGFSKATDLIPIKRSKTSNALEDETDNQKSVVPKISIENCSNISINITFNN